MEKYKNNFKKGMYVCPKCGNKLFKSDAKFDSHTAWPSFREAIKGAVKTKSDNSLGMQRTEIICAKCNNHLGHVFDDGKICGDMHPKAGKRFCVLSDALGFREAKT